MLRICYVGNVAAEPDAAGSILLYRHFRAASGRFEIESISPGLSLLSPWRLCRRAGWLASKFGNKRVAETVYSHIRGRWADRELQRVFRKQRYDAVLTVAHGDLAYAADRAAKAAGLPLVVIFHDWWPDIPSLMRAARKHEEAAFLGLHERADLSLVVSEGMKTALGGGGRSKLLFPIPESYPATERDLPECTGKPFRVLYAGNLVDYSSQLGAAAEESLRWPGVHLEMRGRRPDWPPALESAMRGSGRLLDFLPRHELEDWLNSAHAFLVAMSFDPAMRRRMETSFPSKLTEFSRLGRPLVIWGPEYSSAVRWGLESGCGICVTSPNPAALLAELNRLSADDNHRREMGRRARAAFESQFHPSKLQDVFENALAAAASRSTSGNLKPQ